jgi:hypothetical protein
MNEPFNSSSTGDRASAAVLFGVLFAGALVFADQVPVRHQEGLVHGFLSLRSLDGTLLASGDLLQEARGEHVSSRLVFHFQDGSLYEDAAEYRQRQRFEFVKDHLTQKGPSFPRPLEMTIDGASGQVTVHYTNEHGEARTESEHLDLPQDLANGLILTLMKNVRPETAPKTVSYVAATPKPRLVKFAIASAGADTFSIAGSGRKALHYVLTVDIGGLSGVLAPIVGKQPPDSHIWILGGEVPAFVKSEQALYLGGPLWRIELVSPAWPRPAPAHN